MLPMKDEGGTETDLQKRMAAFVEGQLTWPVLGGTRKCSDCRFYGGVVKSKGRCGRIKMDYKKPGKPFDGKVAIECVKFEVRA